MQAHDLAQAYPTVRMDTDGATAARLLSEHDQPALIVVDDNEHPLAILPAYQVLRMLVPGYVRNDPTLARVLDEESADHMCDGLGDKRVADFIPDDPPALSVVAPDDTVLEIAAIMAASRSPLVAVVEERSKTAPLTGAITATDLLAALLPD